MPTPTKAVKPPKRPGRKSTLPLGSKSPPKPRGVDLGWHQFQTDLVELMKDRAGTWVTYEGRTRGEFGKDVWIADFGRMSSWFAGLNRSAMTSPHRAATRNEAPK